MVKVSVIMPAYNVEQYIERSVKSVMEQTLQEIELIIINDASKDHTWDKISELMTQYGSKIKGINLSKNVRQGGARNRGIREAQGEYIAFVDSDDWIKEDMLEKFYTAMVENDADLVGTNQYYEYYSDTKINLIQRESRCKTELSGKIANKEIREKYMFCLGGMWRNLFKKEIILKNNIWFPEGLSYEDNYFCSLYIAYVNKYVCVDEPFYFYRQNPGSTVYRKDLSQLNRVVVEKMLLEELKQRQLYQEIKEGIDLVFIKRWYISTMGIYFLRLGEDGVGYATQMGEEFRSYFPDYKKNKYYKTELSKVERFKLCVFEMSPKLLYTIYRLREKLR